MGPLHYVSMYTMQIIKKLQSEYICSYAPKQDITNEFNDHCQEWVVCIRTMEAALHFCFRSGDWIANTTTATHGLD